MKTSNTVINILQELEGFEEIAYPCSAGVWTYGYGSTRTLAGNKVTQGMRITREAATVLLKGDVAQFAEQVSRLVQVPLTQNQFDALVSFAYNLGGGALEKSTLLKKLNTKDYNGAAKEFLKWNKARDAKTGKMRVVAGLTNRRKREMELFLRLANNHQMFFAPAPGGMTYVMLPTSNNTPLRNRDLPLPTAFQEHGVDSVAVSSNTGKIAAAATTGVASVGGLATIVADPQIITSGLSFLQTVDWRVAIAVVVVAVCAVLWIRGRRC